MQRTLPSTVLLLPVQITVHSGYPAVPSQVTAVAIKESYNPLRPNAGSSRQELPPQAVSAVQQQVTIQVHACPVIAVVSVLLASLRSVLVMSALVMSAWIIHQTDLPKHTIRHSSVGLLCLSNSLQAHGPCAVYVCTW